MRRASLIIEASLFVAGLNFMYYNAYLELEKWGDRQLWWLALLSGAGFLAGATLISLLETTAVRIKSVRLDLWCLFVAVLVFLIGVFDWTGYIYKAYLGGDNLGATYRGVILFCAVQFGFLTFHPHRR